MYTYAGYDYLGQLAHCNYDSFTMAIQRMQGDKPGRSWVFREDCNKSYQYSITKNETTPKIRLSVYCVF